MINHYKLKGILQNNGWRSDVTISTDKSGNISSITNTNEHDTSATQINGFAIPGFQNAHSHAFQYAMAGLAEVHDTSHTSNNFWSWRDAMYKLALNVNPDQMESIATMLYSEMVRHGYTNVAEFHYLHHDKDGNKYENLSEMGFRMISAAKTAGINITLIPIFYQKGGFGKEPTESQKRFISHTIDDYLKLLESSKKACRYYSGANIGMGIHSMRGVRPIDIVEIAKSGPQDIPFHIHIAEQLKEIDDSLTYLGKRPVEWLLDNVSLNNRYHLVHATHLTKSETNRIAKSQANVVLCPTTEGNLGDGLFPLIDFQKAGGNWSIGTDSHIGINPLEEIRLLDYGQRLITHNRDTFAITNGDSGRFVIDMITKTGRKAMNNLSMDYFKIGDPFNASIIDANSPLIGITSNKNKASSIIYTSDSSHHIGTIVNGELVAFKGRHVKEEKIKSKFLQTLRELNNR